MNRVIIAIALAAETMASASFAQTTNCMAVGQQVFCNTTPQNSFQTVTPYAYQPPQQGMNSMLLGALIARRQAQIEARRAQEAADEQASDTQRNTEFHRSLGALIEGGRCDDARNMALNAGRLQDAALVNQACAPPVTK